MAPQRVTANRKITRVTSYTAAMGHVPDNDLLADQSESHQFMLINWMAAGRDKFGVCYLRRE